MMKDLPENVVENVAIAVVMEGDEGARVWKVYLLNLKDEEIKDILVSSKGYGIYQGEEVKTSVLRHSIGDLKPNSYALIELIQEQLFAINNEYWLSFYQNNVIYDKKYVFVTESIVDSNFIRVPIIGKPGVMIA